MRKAFTLVELLVVVAIIGILMTVLLFNFGGSIESARAAKCLSNMKTLFNAASAVGSASQYWPLAGTERVAGRGSQGKLNDQTWPGWIDWSKSLQPVPFDGSGDLETDTWALANGGGELKQHSYVYGAFWKMMNKTREPYVCPTYAKLRKGGEKILYSYVMNSAFGYDYSRGTKNTKYWQTCQGGGGPKYPNGDAATSPLPPASLQLLFAELPHPVRQGVGSDDYAKDSILQFKATVNGKNLTGYGNWTGSPESIGFVHPGDRNRYYAHVIFRDGHTEKLVEPEDGKGLDAVQLTALLCSGKGYAHDKSGYRGLTEADDPKDEQEYGEEEYSN